MFPKFGKHIFGCLMAAVLVYPAAGLALGSRSFIMANVQARNVIREFSLHAKATKEEIANMIQEKTLFDFTALESVDSWTEQSDTVRTVGKSKADLTLQTTQEFQRAVFFTLLNPQSNGAGFAGMRIETEWDLSSYNNIRISCRVQGNYTGYKVVLRHNGEDNEPYPTYEQMFTATRSAEDFYDVTLPLADFKPYYRGKEVTNGTALNKSRITSFGLQVYGGVYLAVKQSGASALEINTITATV